MRRPFGITASAVVAILGSIITLVFAAGAIASLFIEPTTPRPPGTGAFVIITALFLVTLAGLGIWTAVGLIRTQPWARTSILVFASFAAAFSVLFLLVGMTVPPPPNATRDTATAMRIGFAIFSGVPLLISIWWLIQFTRPSTKAAFAATGAESTRARPLSISILAWVNLVGGVFCLFPLIARAPGFLFGMILTGWSAGILYGVFAALSLYIGKGLLDLRENARVLAICWYGFSLIHTAAITIVPSMRQRMFDMQRTIEGNEPTPIPFDRGVLTNATLVFVALVTAVAIRFLVKHRDWFVRGESPISPDPGPA